MDRRRPILVNEYEEVTDAILRDSVAGFGARVCPKVRVADALEIRGSGLSDEEFSYSLKAHLDFLIVDRDLLPSLAVEFDGGAHDHDPEVKRRDRLKDTICERLGLPLLRVDDGFLRKVGEFRLVGWLAQLWFMSIEHEEHVRLGYFPADSDFDPGLVLCEVRHRGGRAVVVEFPYDPFARANLDILKAAKDGIAYSAGGHVAEDPEGYWVALRPLKLPAGGTILGIGRCRAFHLPPIGGGCWLSQELASADAALKVHEYRQGDKSVVSSAEEVQEWLARFRSWEPQ